MESGKLVGTLGALLVMCMMFSLAMPRKPSEPEATVAQESPFESSGASLEPAPAPAPPAPDLVEGLWSPQGFDFSLPAPEGWEDSRRRKNAYLRSTAKEKPSGNFSVIRLPNLFGRDLAGLEEENRAELEANEQFELREIGIHEVPGGKLLRVAYTGVPRDGSPMHFVGTIWLRGADQVVLTFSCDAGDWPALETEVRASLARMTLGAREAETATRP